MDDCRRMPGTTLRWTALSTSIFQISGSNTTSGARMAPELQCSSLKGRK
uniref:Uncharacterized protein n=1 Tax=Arundo donax TaxID=35708 RepID=A0A0A9FXV6_ARUDO